MLKRWMTMAVIALLAGTGACTGFRQPTIELEGVQLGSVGFTGGTLLVNVRVDNPNRIGFRAEGLTYEMFLRSQSDPNQWERLTTGTFDEEIVIGARETRTVQVPVQFRLSDLGPAASSVMRTGRLDYRVAGTVRVRAAGTSRTVPFRRTGTAMLLGGR